MIGIIFIKFSGYFNDKRKGIILAGLWYHLYPLTTAVSKHLLAIYDKPMIYYPLTVLMQAGIRDIDNNYPKDQEQFKYLLGSGAQWESNLNKIQPKPDGLAKPYSC